MNERRRIVARALIATTAVAVGGFFALSDLLRRLEEAAVLLVLHAGSRAHVTTGHYFQLLPSHHAAFRAQLSPFCSSLVPVLALIGLSGFVLAGPGWRRLYATTCACALVFACNVARVAASLWVGERLGAPALVLFHDWAGTVFALAYTMGGFFLMVYLMLPSATATIQRAARVSDVL